MRTTTKPKTTKATKAKAKANATGASTRKARVLHVEPIASANAPSAASAAASASAPALIPSQALSAIPATTSSKARKTRAAKTPAVDGTAPPKRLSGLDAAAEVLRAADEPLSAPQIIERVLAQKLWTTNGKTPASTIYAAMIREEKSRGTQSRFRKVSRGLFTAA